MIKDIFSLKVYESQFTSYQYIKEETVNKILPFFENKENAKHDLLKNSFSIANTIRDLHTRIDIKPIVDFINFSVNDYWTQLGFSKHLKPYILHMWANNVPVGGYLDSHNHNPNVIAGVFYINASPSMGNLRLENPLELLLGRMPWENNFNAVSFDHEIDVCDGKLILFPGWMKHRTLVNNIDDNRIVLGMNIGCAGPNLNWNEVA